MTKRQREVLTAYADHQFSLEVPWQIRKWLNCGSEHRHGVRLHGLRRILGRLERMGFVQLVRDSSPLYCVVVTEAGRAAIREEGAKP